MTKPDRRSCCWLRQTALPSRSNNPLPIHREKGPSLGPLVELGQEASSCRQTAHASVVGAQERGQRTASDLASRQDSVRAAQPGHLKSQIKDFFPIQEIFSCNPCVISRQSCLPRGTRIDPLRRGRHPSVAPPSFPSSSDPSH